MTGLLNGSRSAKRRAPIAQGGFLEPRQSTWGWSVAGLAVAGPLAFGVVSLIGSSGGGVVAMVVLLLAAAVTGFAGVVGSRRAGLTDKLVEALSPLLGSRPDRSLVTADRWSRLTGGVPRRLRLRYLAGIDDTDPMWVGDIRAQVARRVGVEFDVVRHDRRRCVVELRPAPESEDTETPREVAVRAERVIAELLGSPSQQNPSVTMEWDGDELKSLDVEHSVGARMSRPIYRQQVERTLSTMLPGRWRAKWDLESDKVRFEIRPNLPSSIPHPLPAVAHRDAKKTYTNCELAYGVDEDGHVMTWRPSRNPHMLITGTTGSGKTVTMQGILTEVANYGWRIGINDAKLIEFLGFKEWPNVEVVASNIEEQVRLIHAAWELQEQRYELIVNGEASEEDFEPYVLFLDEFADFREAITDWYADIKVKGDTPKPPVLKRVRSIARKGRTARVHMVVGLQRPDAEFLTGEVRDNFSARASMGRLSPQGALMMWENASTGVSLPRNARGRGITLNEDSQPVEFQSFWTPDPRKTKSDDPENLALLAALRPDDVRHPRKMIVSPRSSADLGYDDDAEPTYTEWATARIVPWDEQLAASLRPKLTVVDGEGKPSPVRAVTSRLELVDNSDDDIDDDDDDDGFGDPEERATAELQAGDMVLLDGSIDLWGVVEAAEPDVVDEEYICVDYRTDDGESGSVSLPSDESITVRKPNESTRGITHARNT